MAIVTGMTGVISHGAAGGEPTTVLANVQDMSYGITVSVAENSSRSTNGWKEKLAAILDGSADFSMTWDGTSAGQIAIRDALEDGTKIALRFEDGTDGYGFWADFIVTEFSHEQPLEDGMTVSVSVKACGAMTPVIPVP